MASPDEKQDIVTAEPVTISHTDGEPMGTPLKGTPEKVNNSQASVGVQPNSNNESIVKDANIKVEEEEKTTVETKLVDIKKEDGSVNNHKQKDGVHYNQNDIKSADTNSKKGSREEKHARRKDERSIDQILKALSGLESPQDKLAALCKKYADSIEENRKLQIQVKNMERRLAQVERERDAAQGEHSKAVLTRSRLEGLCRELQRQNRAIKDESLLKIREEEEKRKEVSSKFQTTLSEINSLMQQNNEKNTKLRDDNIEMTTKFKNVCEQYELRVQQVEKISKQMQLEAQLADAKLAKARMEGAAEKEILLREKQDLLMELAQYQQKCQDLQQTEINLRSQIELYTSKYDEFQNALCRSNQVFGGFKGEMDKMSKKIVKLEKETSTWKQRWEKSHQALLEMATDKQQRDAELSLANRQLTQLHKLCRTLTEERAKLMAQVNTNDPEKQEKLTADIADDRRKLNETLDDVHAVLLERERLYELQQLEKKKQELQIQVQQKQLEQQKQAEDSTASTAGASQPHTSKNDKKKGKKNKNGRQNQDKSESSVSNGNAKKPSASPENCAVEKNTISESVSDTNKGTAQPNTSVVNSSNSESAPAKEEAGSAQTAAATTKMEARSAEALPTKTEPTSTTQEPVCPRAEAASTTVASPPSAPAKKEPAPAKAAPALVKEAPAPAKIEAAPAKAGAVPVTPGPAPAKSEAAPVQVEPAPAKAETPPVKVEPTPAKTEATSVKVESTPAKTESMPVKTEATPAKTEATPAKVEPTPVKVEPTPVKVESAPAKVEPAPVQAKVVPEILKSVSSTASISPVTPVQAVPSAPKTENPSTADDVQSAKTTTSKVKSEAMPSASPAAAQVAFSYAAALGSKPSENPAVDSVPKGSVEKTAEKPKEKVEEISTQSKELNVTGVQETASSVSSKPMSPLPVCDVENKTVDDISLGNTPPEPAIENPAIAAQEPAGPASNIASSATSPQSRKGKEPAKRKKK